MNFTFKGKIHGMNRIRTYITNLANWRFTIKLSRMLYSIIIINILIYNHWEEQDSNL